MFFTSLNNIFLLFKILNTFVIKMFITILKYFPCSKGLKSTSQRERKAKRGQNSKENRVPQLLEYKWKFIDHSSK